MPVPPKRAKPPRLALKAARSKLKGANNAMREPHEEWEHSRIKPAAREIALYYRPSCETTDLTLELSHALDNFHLGQSFLGFVPAQIGRSRAVDNAAQAVVKAQKWAASGDICLETTAIRHYNLAINALRHELARDHGRSMDDALLAAALLYCCETTLDPTIATTSAHNKGLAAILMMVSAKKSTRDGMSRSIFFYHWKGTFNLPVVLGQASPFDNYYWASKQPAMVGMVGEETDRLRWLAQKLFIRLPRLIALVREVRGGALAEDALQLADELALCRDDNAENALLHGLKVVKTLTHDPQDAQFLPFSYQFKDTSQFEGALYYWQLRILANRLLFTLLESTLNKDDMCRVQRIKDDNTRMAISIMMSFRFALSVGSVGGWALCLGWTAVWGPVRDVDCIQRGIRTLWSSKLRPWLLDKYEELHRGHLKVQESDMDEAAEMLVGGPLGAGLITGQPEQLASYR